MEKWSYQPAQDHGLAPVERARSVRREAGLISTITHAAWWTGVRSYLTLWHRLRIVGRENLPVEPPFVLVANHASHLDALVLAAPMSTRLRDVVFPIAAADVFFENGPVSLFASMMLNALPMHRANRGRHALADLRSRLVEEPCAYILFPEGARSRTGEMLKVKAGIGMMVAGLDVPVVPCWLDGCFEAMRPGCVVPRPRVITVHVGKAERFVDQPNTREGWDAVAERLEGRIKALRPVRG
ncbi:MAG: 1-acyl-sn-glycerol-3-phosphate acyltransferase [Phycisphaerales bacterium]|nr:1-acyl-sn-glycerol-3-phosphate acyltransferase [Phycisphaerales bacterium]